MTALFFGLLFNKLRSASGNKKIKSKVFKNYLYCIAQMTICHTKPEARNIL